MFGNFLFRKSGHISSFDPCSSCELSQLIRKIFIAMWHTRIKNKFRRWRLCEDTIDKRKQKYLIKFQIYVREKLSSYSSKYLKEIEYCQRFDLMNKIRFSIYLYDLVRSWFISINIFFCIFNWSIREMKSSLLIFMYHQ